jgi:hypothetical protein
MSPEGIIVQGARLTSAPAAQLPSHQPALVSTKSRTHGMLQKEHGQTQLYAMLVTEPWQLKVAYSRRGLEHGCYYQAQLRLSFLETLLPRSIPMISLHERSARCDSQMNCRQVQIQHNSSTQFATTPASTRQFTVPSVQILQDKPMKDLRISLVVQRLKATLLIGNAQTDLDPPPRRPSLAEADEGETVLDRS